MLSYQHGFHAGNLADVHKHALLAWMLAYLSKKDKPLSYIETHAGRGLYDLDGAQAVKTGEAAQGIDRFANLLTDDDPYAIAIRSIREKYGPRAYPGSPLIAAQFLRPMDKMTLSELHPTEHSELCNTMRGIGATIYKRDGFETAFAVCPPTPRRGLMLIDPSYEVKSDWDMIPKHMTKLTKAWNVGVITLWYPLLRNKAHYGLRENLQSTYPEGLCSEIRFPPARPGHGMVGSGMFIINSPFGLDSYVKKISQKFAKLINGKV